MKYFAYIRRSCEDKKKQIQSLPKQTEWCEKKALARGIKIEKVFQDTKSASKLGRDGFHKMMEAIEKSKEPVGLLCWKISRLARNPIDEGAVKYAFIRGKIKHILAGDREYNEGENQIIMGIGFSQSTQFSLELSKDVKEGMDKKIEKGWRPTYASLGYINDPYGLKGEKKIYKDPERWELVKEGWMKLLTGVYTVSEIQSCMNEKGLRTRKGCKVALSTWYKVFTNQFYTGYFEWHDGLIKGEHDAMISQQDFDKAQIILGRDGKPRKNKHKHTFTGLIRCAECGCMITAEPPKIKTNKTNNKIRIYHYMRCTKKNPKVRCSQKFIQVKDLEKQFYDLLESIEIPESFTRWAFKELRRLNKKETKGFTHQRSQIQKQYNENEAMIESLIDKLTKGVISDEMYQSCEKRYTQKREELQKDKKRYENMKDDWIERIEKTFSFAKTAKAEFADGDKNKKREIFARLGSNFLLKDKELALELKECFQIIEKGMEKTKAEIPSFEPLKKGIDITKNEDYKCLIPVWSALLDDIRTLLLLFIKSIPPLFITSIPVSLKEARASFM